MRGQQTVDGSNSLTQLFVGTWKLESLNWLFTCRSCRQLTIACKVWWGSVCPNKNLSLEQRISWRVVVVARETLVTIPVMTLTTCTRPRLSLVNTNQCWPLIGQSSRPQTDFYPLILPTACVHIFCWVFQQSFDMAAAETREQEIILSRQQQNIFHQALQNIFLISVSQIFFYKPNLWREKRCNYLIKCWLNAFKVSTVGIQLTMRSQTSNLVANQSEKFTTTTDHWTIQLLDTTNKITTSHFKLSIN